MPGATPPPTKKPSNRLNTSKISHFIFRPPRTQVRVVNSATAPTLKKIIPKIHLKLITFQQFIFNTQAIQSFCVFGLRF